MQWYIDVLKKYAVFSGRARRKEYWMFVLFNVIVSIILSILDRILGLEQLVRLAVDDLQPGGAAADDRCGDPAHARHRAFGLVDPDQPDPVYRVDLVHRPGCPGGQRR